MDCPLCQRSCPTEVLEDHHLRTKRVDPNLTVRICTDCHKTIHGLFTHKQLRQTDLGTVKGLLANEKFQRALDHIRKLPPGSYMRMRLAKARGR